MESPSIARLNNSPCGINRDRGCRGRANANISVGIRSLLHPFTLSVSGASLERCVCSAFPPFQLLFQPPTDFPKKKTLHGSRNEKISPSRPLLSADEIVLLAFNKPQLWGVALRIFESCLLSHQRPSVSLLTRLHLLSLWWSFSQPSSLPHPGPALAIKQCGTYGTWKLLPISGSDS